MRVEPLRFILPKIIIKKKTKIKKSTTKIIIKDLTPKEQNNPRNVQSLTL